MIVQLRIRHIPLVLAAIVASGILLGYLLERTFEGKPPIVLTGSGNVYPYLKRNLSTLKGKEPLWLDIGSGNALRQIFAAFDYGRSVKTGKRAGLCAMSSGGTQSLSDEFSKNTKASGKSVNDDYLTKDNYFLSIVVARPPLFVLYRGATQQLRVESTNRMPPEGGPAGRAQSPAYRFVRWDHLRHLIETNSDPDLWLYLPEADSGTRNLVDPGQKMKWPAIEQVPDTMEQLKGSFSFASLESELLISSDEPDASACNLLKEYGLQTALVCADVTQCSRFITAEFTVVFKLSKEAGGEGSNLFYLQNEAECELAQELSPSDVTTSCQVHGKVRSADHILELRGHMKTNFPAYHYCG